MRGHFVTVALQGDFGKPRPAVTIQSDLFEEHPSVTILPLTSKVVQAPLFRITIDPSPENGLRHRSQIMIDKLMTVPRSKVGPTLGKLTEDEQISVNRSLMLFLGIA